MQILPGTAHADRAPPNSTQSTMSFLQAFVVAAA
jgi:hypothetical protein